MELYIVDMGKVVIKHGMTNSQAEEVHEREFFEPLRNLATKLAGELLVVNEMKVIGIAIVEASDNAVATMEALGWQVHEDGTVTTC